MKAITSIMPKSFRRFARDRRGISAVEFALLAPMMIALYLGCIEISDGVATDRKVSLTAASVANLAAQVTTINNADMTNILNASTAIIAPYSASKIKITVSCLNIDAQGRATVEWSDTRNGAARAVGSTVSIPSALAVANSHLIFSEVTYAYTPIAGFVITGAINLSDRMFMTPRQSTTVSRTAT